MADDLTKRGPPDARRINVHEDWELRDWAAHFCVTQAKLLVAVREVGPMVADVKRRLGR